MPLLPSLAEISDEPLSACLSVSVIVCFVYVLVSWLVVGLFVGVFACLSVYHDYIAHLDLSQQSYIQLNSATFVCLSLTVCGHFTFLYFVCLCSHLKCTLVESILFAQLKMTS